MERRSGAGIIVRNIRSVQRRFPVFIPTAAMIFTNAGANTNTAHTVGLSELVIFSMGDSQPVKAVEGAIVGGNEITVDDLDFTNGEIAEFGELLFGEGETYGAFSDPEGGSVDVELRMFICLPEDADDMYMITDGEEIIFLYVNSGEGTVSCTTEITRMDDGTGKVRKIKWVAMKSYEAAHGDEEVDTISKPVETPAPEKAQEPSAGETTSLVETVNPEETTVPDENATVPGETTIPEETIVAEESTSPDESTTVPGEIDATGATTTAPEESQTEAQSKETTEAIEENTPETEAPETKAPKTESVEPVTSIIRHYTPVVASGENSEAVPEIKEEIEAPEPGKEEEPKGTETSKKEDTAEITEATEATEEITGILEAVDPVESAQAPEESVEDIVAEVGKEIIILDTEDITPAESSSADSSEGKVNAPPKPEEAVGTVMSSTVEQAEKTPSEEAHVSEAGTVGLVGMGHCSTTKAYVTTINQLKALGNPDGYKACYATYSEVSAWTVEGLRSAEEGGTLTFDAKNQLSPAIDYVSINGEITEADTAIDNDNGSQTAWYSIPNIYGEQDAQVYMNEAMAYSAVELEPTVIEDGVIIYISIDEGVLPVGVTISAVRISEDAENAVKEAAQAGVDGAIVSSVTAYDINLWLGDKLLDFDVWGGNKQVKVTFVGALM